MKKKVLITSVILLLLVAAGYAFWTTTNKKEKAPEIKKPKELPKEATVTLDKDGYSPNVVTVKVGAAVRWNNVSGEDQTVNSDNYPTNQLHKELNFGVFSSGSSVVYIFKKPGTYGYHNQLKPEQKGKVIVEE